MSPERKTTIEGTTVAEYYWAGRYVVYVNNRATDESYEEAIERLESKVTKGE